MNKDKLVRAYSDACRVTEKAYAPYSRFKVGAAVVVGSGKVFTGVNVENMVYGETICAERAAIAGAVCEGESDIKVILAVTEDGRIVPPCGSCRQVIFEFNPKCSVVVAGDSPETFKIVSVEDLLPEAFQLHVSD